MENFEQKPEKNLRIRPKAEYIYSEQVEEIALHASEIKEFQDAVSQAKSRLKAITAVRELLRQRFPEINKIPEPKVESMGLLPPAKNEFRIAKHIIDLLFEK